MKIAWSIKIPNDAKLKVKKGEGVECGDLVYEYHQNIVERLPLIGWQNLGSNDRKIILQNIVKRDLVKDEILKEGSWLSNNIIKSPSNGKCMGVDEFGNIELETEKYEKYLAPISAEKIRIEDGKVVFELKGTEFECDGLNQLKAWGDFCGDIKNDLDKINSQQIGQIVIVKDSLEAAIKAEAIGVSGLILVDIDKVKEFEDCDVPVVIMKEDEANKLMKFVDGNTQIKIWLNAGTGKVLVVLE